MGAVTGHRARRPTPRPRPSHRQRLDQAIETYTRAGSGRPMSGRLVQLGRWVAFAIGGILVVSLTDGAGSPLHLASWWAEPIVIEKLAIWTLLWQLLGLGRGLAPFGVSALPPVAGLSYWLTPGTMRMAPWPRVPGTAGTRRTLVDVVLYAVVLAIGAGLLGFTGAVGGTLPAAGVWALFAALLVLGLRDRTPVLAARPEIFTPVLLAFLLPAGESILALKLVLVSLCWLAAVMAANRHLPFAVATTLADAPWLRSSRLRQALWQRDDHDLAPADLPRRTANVLVGVAFVLPLLLLFARGGALSAFAVGLALVVLVALASTMSRRSQLESATFLGYATAAVFGHFAYVGWNSITSAVPVAALAVGLAALIVAAATLPQFTAALSPWRHAAAAGPVSMWLLRRSAAGRFDVPVRTGSDDSELHYRDLAVLALHPNGRALDGLLPRVVADVEDYLVRPAEFMAGAALGWSIDGGYGHDRQLLAAVQERCGFEPGDLRVVTLAAHSTLRSDYRYRILDAASGLLEDGFVDVDDMVDRVPWLDPALPAIPVEISFSVSGATGFTAPATYDIFAAEPAPVVAAPAAVAPAAVAPALAAPALAAPALAAPALAVPALAGPALAAPEVPAPAAASSPRRVWAPVTEPTMTIEPFEPAPVIQPIAVASLGLRRPATAPTSSLVELAVEAATRSPRREPVPAVTMPITEPIAVVVVPPRPPRPRPVAAPPVRQSQARHRLA